MRCTEILDFSTVFELVESIEKEYHPFYPGTPGFDKNELLCLCATNMMRGFILQQADANEWLPDYVPIHIKEQLRSVSLRIQYLTGLTDEALCELVIDIIIAPRQLGVILIYKE